MRNFGLHRRRTSETPTPDIAIYVNRPRTMVWLALGAGSCVLLFLLCISILIIMGTIPGALNEGSIACAIVFCGFAVMEIWPVRVIANLWASKEPVLVINHEGIRVGKIYSAATIFLAWKNVEAIYMLGNGLSKQLYIRPVDVRLFLSQYNLLMRFFLRMNLMNGAPIAIAQSLLEKPIEEIVEQLQNLYTEELLTHHIQLKR